MKIFVKAKPGAKENKVTPPPLKLVDDGVEKIYIVSTKEQPVDGRANKAITRLLAEHFGLPRSQVKLVSGANARRKVFEIGS